MRTTYFGLDIDGSNLYYGCLKRTPYSWLDLKKLSARMLPINDMIVPAIVYYELKRELVSLTRKRQATGSDRRNRVLRRKVARPGEDGFASSSGTPPLRYRGPHDNSVAAPTARNR